eukprot:TRINITY_DN2957_c0_g1_i2.p2 TRINITY_DN2957_c0_g1~~TRINITY_DN2957_c0_g1_i2.p2  ORF type:complete len:102 (+),score=11.05 TRINITY_DN2957_c0_g1_i2:3-308(+)
MMVVEQLTTFKAIVATALAGAAAYYLYIKLFHRPRGGNTRSPPSSEHKQPPRQRTISDGWSIVDQKDKDIIVRDEGSHEAAAEGNANNRSVTNRAIDMYSL